MPPAGKLTTEYRDLFLLFQHLDSIDSNPATTVEVMIVRPQIATRRATIVLRNAITIVVDLLLRPTIVMDRHRQEIITTNPVTTAARPLLALKDRLSMTDSKETVSVNLRAITTEKEAMNLVIDRCRATTALLLRTEKEIIATDHARLATITK